MIELLENRTEKDPLAHIGFNAGVCWGADVKNNEKNVERGKTCLKDGHLRTSEYPDVEMVISGYSARCIRELYTHIIGVTRLQESTRYVNCAESDYFVPTGLTEEQHNNYTYCMNEIFSMYQNQLNIGVSKEDAANVLPLGMDTKIVWKINLRALIHFMEMRKCTRAYKEIRQLAQDIYDVLVNYSDEWKWIAEKFFVPSCISRGYCIESKCCGRAPKGISGLKKDAISKFLSFAEAEGLSKDCITKLLYLSNKYSDILVEEDKSRWR